jgi:hypothetical protein
MVSLRLGQEKIKPILLKSKKYERVKKLSTIVVLTK